MKWTYAEAGYSKYYKDNNGNSIIRSIALAENKDYKEIDELMSKYIEKEQLDDLYVSNARTGVSKEVAYELLNDLGYKWIPTMKFGVGCKTHLKDGELPKKGTLIVSISKNFTCIKDNVIYDVYNPTRDGKRCCYGYFIKEKV